MYKRLIALLLALVLVVGILPVGLAFEQSLRGSYPGRIQLTTKGEAMAHAMSYLEFKGSDGNYNTRSMDFIYWQNGDQQIPAYCKQPDKATITTTGTPPGHSEEFIADAYETDPWVLAVMACGYGALKPTDLGFSTDTAEGDVCAAYYATKAALWAGIQGLNPDTDIQVSSTLHGDTGGIATKVLNACRTIYKAAQAWVAAYNGRLSTDKDTTPRILCTPDHSYAYPVNIGGTEYLQQIFTVSVAGTADKLVGDITFTPKKPDKSARITNMSNVDIETLSTSGGSVQFKVLIPTSTPEPNGTISITLKGKASRTEVYVARIADGRSGIQLFVIPAAPETDFSLEITPTWMREKKGTLKITKEAKADSAKLAAAEFEVTFPDGTIQKNLVTGEDGTVSLVGLEPGLYVVQEVTPPPGYVICAPSAQTVTIPLDGTGEVTFQDTRAGGLRIKKTNEAGDTLEGVSFEITGPGSFKKDGKTNRIGTLFLSELEPGTYYVRETATIGDYYPDTETVYPVEVQEGKTAEVTVVNHPYPVIKIIKKDEKDTLLEGVRFHITRQGDPRYSANEATDAHGEILLEHLDPGTYVIEEEAPADGYEPIDTPQTVVLSANSGIVTVTVLNYSKPGLRIHKQDQDNHPLPGAKFSVQAKGSVYPAVTYPVVRADGIIDLSNLDAGTYIIKEESAPDGYALDRTVREVELVPGKVSDVVFVNKPLPEISIEKTDADTGTPVSGVSFALFSLSGELKYTFPDTDTAGKTSLTVQDGVYYLREMSVPANYLRTAEDQLVELNPGDTKTISLTNHQRPTLTIQKESAAEPGKGLPGAEFLIEKLDGSWSYTCTTGLDGTVSIPQKDLEAGWYRITETKSPAGFSLDPDPQVHLLSPGEHVSVTFRDEPLPGLTVQKTDAVSGAGLEGALFNIYAVSGVGVEKALSDNPYRTGKDGVIHLTGLTPGIYRIEEIQAPDGYQISAPSEQTVYLTSGGGAAVSFADAPESAIVLIKKDRDTGKLLPGAVFEVRKVTVGTSGPVIGRYTTGSYGAVTIPNLEAGMYIVQEVEAPENYALDPTPRSVYLDGTLDDLQTLTFEDTAPGSFQIIKQAGDTNLPLAGAQFRISCDAWSGRNSVYTTGADGTIYLTGLTPGQTLRVQEIASPSGYVLDSTVWEIPITAGETYTLPLVNQPYADLILRKTDDKHGKLLEGAQFRITDVDGNPAGPNPDGLYTTDRSGQILLEDIKPGVYLITEVRAPEGYALETYSKTVVLHPSDHLTVPFQDTALGGLLIRKVDASTKAPLANVQFKITDSNRKPVGDAPDGIYQTDTNGRIWLPGLPAGTYRIQEVAAAAGYQIDNTVYTAKVTDGDTETVTIENHPLGGILIHKVDASTGDPLAGVEFKITDGNGVPLGGSQGIYTTDVSGDIYLKDIAAGVTLRIQEAKALSGYVLDDKVYTATAKAGELVTLRIENVHKGGLIVQKTDALTGKPLAGAEFLITSSDGTFVTIQNGYTSGNGRYTTDENGRISLYGLEPGSYVATELKSPEGYIRETASKTVELSADEVQTLTFPNMPRGGLTVLKTDAKTEKAIQGVQFSIVDSAGKPVGDGIYTTDEAGAIRLPDLKAGTYTVTEHKAAAGYLADSTAYTAEVSDGDTAVLRITNTPAGKLEIHKIEAGSKKPLTGAVLTITDPDGKQTTLTTDQDGAAVLDGLVAGQYKVQESKAPDGYVLSDTTYTVSVTAGEASVLTVPNTPMGRLELRKVDAATKEPLAGAVLTVTGPDGTKTTLATDDNGIAILDNLAPGQYQVQEKDAPKGYLLSDTVYTVTLKAGSAAVQMIPNAKVPEEGQGVLMLVKLDKDTRAPLSGAVFEVTASDGSKITLTTDHTGLAAADLAPGTYQVVETAAPKGYVLDNTVRSVVLVSNKATTLEILNAKAESKGTLTIEKNDETQPDRPVPGVSFEIYSADGTRITTLTTDAQGKAAAELAAGTYYAVEAGCPEGYILDSTRHEFTVEAGKTATLAITNRQYASILLHKRDSKTGAGIPNVSFLLTDANGRTVGTYTTGADGYVSIDRLDAANGPFWLQETAAAPGYVQDTARKSLTLTPGQTLNVDWLNDPVQNGSGRIQITKTAAAAVPEQGISAGAPLAGAVYTVSDATTGEVLGTMETGPDGTAQTKDLPLGRYYITENKAPAGFRLDSTPMIAEITVSGETVQLTQEDWPLSLGVSIAKRGNQEIQPGQMLTYTLSDIANLSDSDLSQFYWRDTLPAGVELLQITTGTYNTDLLYRVEYKTNRRDYRVLADGLSSTENHAFAMGAADLGLADGEFVTEVRLAFGNVPAGFTSVEGPILQVQVPADMGGTMIRNVADVGGLYGDRWLTETASWETAVRTLDEDLPKTGF